MKRVLFYSSVSSMSLFSLQRFYSIDIDILKSLGYSVTPTNRIEDFLRWRDYDIAFIYFYRYGLLPAAISRALGKKVFFTGGIDALDEALVTPREYRIQKRLFRACYRTATRCFIVSSSDYRNVERVVGVNPRKAVLAFHAINERLLERDATPRVRDFATIAWMETSSNALRKGLDVAIRLFAFLQRKAEFSGSRFFIIGKEGEGSELLREMVSREGIRNVVFTGPLSEEEKEGILASCSYYLQLSRYEGFGLAALEALAKGCVVVHSGRGGLSDILSDHGVPFDLAADFESEAHKVYLSLSELTEEARGEMERRAVDFISDRYTIRTRMRLLGDAIGAK